MREHGIVGFMGAPYLPREACDCRCMFGVGSSLWGFVRPSDGEVHAGGLLCPALLRRPWCVSHRY